MAVGMQAQKCVGGLLAFSHDLLCVFVCFWGKKQATKKGLRMNRKPLILL